MTPKKGLIPIEQWMQHIEDNEPHAGARQWLAAFQAGAPPSITQSDVVPGKQHVDLENYASDDIIASTWLGHMKIGGMNLFFAMSTEGQFTIKELNTLFDHVSGNKLNPYNHLTYTTRFAWIAKDIAPEHYNPFYVKTYGDGSSGKAWSCLAVKCRLVMDKAQEVDVWENELKRYTNYWKEADHATLREAQELVGDACPFKEGI